MSGTLQDLASSIGSSGSGGTRSEVMITGLDDRTDSPQETFVFQYFPESINDTKQINRSTKDIPGLSLPLYQFTSGGERSISFQAYFSTDLDLLAHGVSKAAEIFSRVKEFGLTRSNVDIRTAMTYLRGFLLPRYGESDAGLGMITFAPRKIMLTIPRSGIGMLGGATSEGMVMPDSVVCLMSQCDVTFEAFFPSGLPKIASVQLTFVQTAQYGGQVQLPQAQQDVLRMVSNTGFDKNDLGAMLSGMTGGLFQTGDADPGGIGLQPYSIQPRKLKK